MSMAPHLAEQPPGQTGARELLPAEFFEPFDITYNRITETMTERAKALGAPREAWLRTLIKEFQDERKIWDRADELQGYRVQCKRLRPRYLRLIAGAYLHISYDLPRVIANNWPGGPRFANGPTEFEATLLYLGLAELFPGVMEKLSSEARVMGRPLNWVVRLPLIRELLVLPDQWIQHLRSGAWMHANILRQAPDRDNREARMREAMAAALEHVSLWRPWSFALLHPPSLMAPRVFAIAVGGLVVGDAWLGVLGTVAALLIMGLPVVWLLKWIKDLYLFTDEFGRRVSEYMSIAVTEPGNLFPHLKERAPKDDG